MIRDKLKHYNKFLSVACNKSLCYNLILSSIVCCFACNVRVSMWVGIYFVALVRDPLFLSLYALMALFVFPPEGSVLKRGHGRKRNYISTCNC